MVPAVVSRAVREAPALHLEAVPGMVLALATFLGNATPAQQAAFWSLATIGGGVASGLLKRPAHVAIGTATVTTVTANMAVLGLHLPHAWAAVALALASLVPVAANRRPPVPQAAPLPAGGLAQGPGHGDSVPLDIPAR